MHSPIFYSLFSIRYSLGVGKTSITKPDPRSLLLLPCRRAGFYPDSSRFNAAKSLCSEFTSSRRYSLNAFSYFLFAIFYSLFLGVGKTSITKPHPRSLLLLPAPPPLHRPIKCIFGALISAYTRSPVLSLISSQACLVSNALRGKPQSNSTRASAPSRMIPCTTPGR